MEEIFLFLVILPTYNEADNITRIIPGILDQRPDIHVLVVDDNSPDKTADKADRLAQQRGDGRIHLLRRKKKAGLGSAYAAGFAFGLARNYKGLVQMDADGSHGPAYLPAMLDALDRFDFVVGSRYVKGGGIRQWGRVRQWISAAGNRYAKQVLNCPVADMTGGFNAWRPEVLAAMKVDSLVLEGYAFQVELKYRAWKLGFSATELPIVFAERQAGRSKFSKKIILEAALRVWQFRFDTRLFPAADRGEGPTRKTGSEKTRQ